MNGIDKIIARMESDTQAECDAIAAQSAAEAEAILAQYRADADKLLQDAQPRCKELEAQQLERLEGSSRLACRQRVLSEKQSLLDEAFSRAAQALARLPRGQYIDLLAALAAENGQGGEELLFSPADRDAVGQAVTDAANAKKSGASFTPVRRDTGDRRRPGAAPGPHGDQLRLCRAAAPGAAGGLLRRGRCAV